MSVEPLRPTVHPCLLRTLLSECAPQPVPSTSTTGLSCLFSFSLPSFWRTSRSRAFLGGGWVGMVEQHVLCVVVVVCVCVWGGCTHATCALYS